MKKEKLQDAIGMVGDDLIQEAANTEPAKKARVKWIALVAAMLSAFMVMGIGVAMHFNSPESEGAVPMDQEIAEISKESFNIDATPFVLQKAVYPERVLNYSLTADLNDSEAYDKWQNDRDSFRAAYNSNTPDLSKFIEYSTKAFLSDTEDNAIYSPVNVYMALAMLAETSGGESRAQILDALGSDSIESLRTDANALWNALYTDDGTAKTVLANSLWLREEGEYKREPLEILAEKYYASTFEGRMGSKEYDEVLRGWLNEQTDGMLTDQVKGIGLPEDTVLALASTILFNAKWADEFNPERNTEEVFNGTNGKVRTEFMNESRNGSVSVGDNFMAYKKYFTENGHMTFILPKEGKTP